jgi:ADP-ribose pyrophosphatase
MRIIRSEKLTDEKWLNLFAAHFQHNGHEGRWVFASRKKKAYGRSKCDAVVIVPLLRNPGEPVRLVMIHEFRIPVGKRIFAFPAGLVDKGETVESTVRREVAEETGLKVTKIHRVTQPLFSSAGVTDETVAMAFADVRGVVNPAPEQSEDLEVVLLDYEGVCHLCDDNKALVDAKAWMTLLLYRQLGGLDGGVK